MEWSVKDLRGEGNSQIEYLHSLSTSVLSYASG